MRQLAKIAALALVATLSLTSCGSDDNKSDSEACAGGNGPKVGLAYDVGGRGDQSFNDSAWAGMQKALDELDASCIEAKAGENENDTVRAERLRTLAEQGYNPVIAVGFIYSPAAREVAKEFPDTDFAVIDGYSLFCCADDEIGQELPNLVDLTFAEHEGSYLVGVVAALKTEADHIGFVGGTHSDLIKKFEAGYVQGARSVNPDIKIEIQYLTEDPNDGATGFENPSGGKTAAEGQLDKGADVIYHAAGKSGLGVFQAVEAKGEGNWAIGVDSDQYLSASEGQKKIILTSMLKRIDTAVFDYIKAFADGEAPAGAITLTLADDGVGYSTSGGYIDDITAQVDEAAAGIKDGSITVSPTP
ncbi:BMP family ABC transporter substrate-binding protein [Nocardioides sp. AE5]|uniref:BMP family lipoprotein n=1 Tax=Nocardioides sp. AE5 TaxID=2962573 RepID=UPI002880C46C|nr:BMP family ABC transporter substrate-binding protein [Nocardioides sp. AE5]MDT0201969.1 BMP family ABC transporter substrate-binding protein [Nocardioides sp. AE5]